MIVYSGTKKQFINDVSQGQIADLIDSRLAELEFTRESESEYNSWQNSLPRMCLVLDDEQIADDVDIAIEYQIPLTSRRVDFLIGGKDENNFDNIVIVELKQWTKAKKLSRENLVGIETFTGGALRTVVHPSQQAYSYAMLIQNFNQSVNEENIKLRPCAFLHNYKSEFDSELLGSEYEEVIKEAPLFLKQGGPKLTEYIKKYVRNKSDKKLFKIIDEGKLKPSKALQDAVGSVLNGNREFVMVMEQQVAYATVLKLVQNYVNKDEKQVVIVEGGPGTGKSVVAINLLSKIIESGYSSNYVTKNSAPRKAFSESLVKGKYSLQYLKGLFRGSGSYYNCSSNAFDCLIVDEAHRLKLKSGFHSNLGENQVKELINSAKITVFFIDEDQKVTTKDIGTIDEIKKWARFYNAKVHSGKEYLLTSQFRCGGSDGYLAFLDDLLMIRPTANRIYELDYDIRVFDSASDMREVLREKNSNNKARMIAGYCYEWISRDFKAAYDIKLPGNFRAQWNFTTDDFAIDPESFEQVGCIHSTQGLEFEYVGIIIGNDLRYENGKVITDQNEIAESDHSSGVRRCRDKALADRIIRNTYKTLLSRGQKGCFIYCENAPLADYIKNRINECNDYNQKLIT